MKRVFIYVLSLIIGIIIGVISYSLIRFNTSNSVDSTILDYKFYKNILSNLSKINVTYGENIDFDTPTEKIVNYAFNTLDLYEVLDPLDDNCIYTNCFGKTTSYILNKDVLRSSFRSFYGPDRRFEFRDFKFINGYKKGKCFLTDEDEYECTITENEDFLGNINYKVKSANFEGDIIHIRTYAFYIDDACDSKGKVCLYADRELNNRVAKCKKSEIDDYLDDFNLLDIKYKKSSDNKYYLYSLKW